MRNKSCKTQNKDSKKTSRQRWDDNTDSISPLAEQILGMRGKMISMSKSLGPVGTIYNANIFNKKSKRIWFGDIDIQRYRERLLQLAEYLGTLYILPEHPQLGKCPGLKDIQPEAFVIVGDRVWVDDQFVIYMQRKEKRLASVQKGSRAQKPLKPVADVQQKLSNFIKHSAGKFKFKGI